MAGLGGKKDCCGTPSGWAEYSARVKILLGLLTSEVLEPIALAAREFRRGEVYLTARLGMEIPGITEDRFPLLQERRRAAMLRHGTRAFQEDRLEGIDARKRHPAEKAAFALIR